MKRSKYSQEGEEEFVIDYFRVTHGRGFKGRVLDIGANDGILYSNSKALIENSWEAILVEPSTAAYAKLKELYGDNKDVHLCNFALGTINGTVPFYESGNIGHTEDDVALLSTICTEQLAMMVSQGVEVREYRVQSFKFENFLRLVPQRMGPIFDFISIDVEGMDYQILTQIDLTAVQCQCLCIEYVWGTPETTKFQEYAEKHGMKLSATTKHNLIFTRE